MRSHESNQPMPSGGNWDGCHGSSPSAEAPADVVAGHHGREMIPVKVSDIAEKK